jgi:ribosome silencing factor RsfS/YbeB/iojap
MPRSAEALVRLAARAALDKKAVDLVALDLQGMSSLADFFLVCTGRSTAQIDSIVEAIQIALRAEGIRVRHREGTAESGWLLLDRRARSGLEGLKLLEGRGSLRHYRASRVRCCRCARRWR